MLAATLAPGRGRAQFDLQSKMPFQIANVLMDCGVPFVFATGCDKREDPGVLGTGDAMREAGRLFITRDRKSVVRLSASAIQVP
jgi:hypothetical protein